jgi:hypothetical protein
MGGASALGQALGGVGRNAMAGALYSQMYGQPQTTAPSYPAAAYLQDLNPFARY